MQVLRRWKEAKESGQGGAMDRALSWLGGLPQLLLRKHHRGGRGGRNAVAARFNALTMGDWGTLVDLLERDWERRQEREGRRRVLRQELARLL